MERERKPRRYTCPVCGGEGFRDDVDCDARRSRPTLTPTGHLNNHRFVLSLVGCRRCGFAALEHHFEQAPDEAVKMRLLDLLEKGMSPHRPENLPMVFHEIRDPALELVERAAGYYAVCPGARVHAGVLYLWCAYRADRRWEESAAAGRRCLALAIHHFLVALDYDELADVEHTSVPHFLAEAFRGLGETYHAVKWHNIATALSCGASLAEKGGAPEGGRVMFGPLASFGKAELS